MVLRDAICVDVILQQFRISSMACCQADTENDIKCIYAKFIESGFRSDIFAYNIKFIWLLSKI